MSTVNDTRDALQTHLHSLKPVWPTAWENVLFKADDLTQFQRANVLWGETKAAGLGGGANSGEFWQGHLVVSCFIESNIGTKTAEERADAVMNHFYRGLSLISGTVVVTIEQAFLGKPAQEPDWYGIDVWVPWHLHANL